MDQSQYNQVSLKNIGTEPFDCIYNNQSYGVIMPGQTRSFFQLMADLFLKHLINDILNRRNQPTSRLDLREALASQIVVSINAAVQEAPKTEDEVLQEKVLALNKPSDLELLMVKTNPQPAPQIEQPIAPPPMPPSAIPSDLGDVLSGVSQEQKVLHPTPPMDTTPPVPPPPPVQPQVFATQAPQIQVPSEQPVVLTQSQATVNSVPSVDTQVPPVLSSDSVETGTGSLPTRQVLVDYARDTLMINPDDPKTKEAWETMSDRDLAKELNYEAPI